MSSKAPSIKLTPVFLAILVRAILILHNLLAVWRVVVTREDAQYWGLITANFFTFAEGFFVVKYNKGIEWKWWCPCFLCYLLSTLPSLWLLQLSQYDHSITGQNATDDSPYTQLQVGSSNHTANYSSYYNATVVLTTTISTTNYSDENYTDESLSTIISTEPSYTTTNTTSTGIFATIDVLLNLGEQTWIVMIQESLVYLIIFGRWVLPRAHTSRADLSELLLEFLAMASDIMELYALFDEDLVQSNLGLTYAILGIWSVSFLQFIPILKHKAKFQHLESARMKRITRACGDYFAEVVVTCTSIILQDGPFLCLRMYILVELQLITYSLVFFVVKNFVTILLLLYRLGVLCLKLPCCYNKNGELEKVETVDFSQAITVNTMDNYKQPNRNHMVGNFKSPIGNYRNPKGYYTMGDHRRPLGNYKNPIRTYKRSMGNYENMIGNYRSMPELNGLSRNRLYQLGAL